MLTKLLHQRIKHQCYQQCKRWEENNTKSRHPATVSTEENIDNVHYMVMNDKQLTIKQIAGLLAYPMRELRILCTMNSA